MEINHDQEDDFSEKTLSETQSEALRTIHDHNDDDGSSSSSSSSSYFLHGKTSKTKSKKLLDLGQKINSLSTVGNQAPPAPQEGLRSCPYCGQEFRSGKALGGHIRIHKSVKPADSKPSVAADNQKDNVCFICKERFPSVMSLCGHMRNHPERDWKGIRPPNGTAKPQSEPQPEPQPEPEPEPDIQPAEQHEPQPVLNLQDSISNWSVTGKRGRKATISAEKLRMIDQLVLKKKRKIQGSEAGRVGLKTENAAGMEKLEEWEILEMDDLPEEGEIIEEEHDIHKVDNKSDTISDHRGEFALSDHAPRIENKKIKREANNPSSIVKKCKIPARQHYGEITSQARDQAPGNHNKTFVRMPANKGIDLGAATAGKNSGRLDHKARVSLKANQTGTLKMLNLDLNLPYEE